MLGEIIKELTKVHENEEITSENVLSWAKRVEVQRAQSTIMNSLMEAKKFDELNALKMYTRKAQEDTCRQKHPQCRHVSTVVAAIPQDNAQHMEKDVQIATKLATSEQYA